MHISPGAQLTPLHMTLSASCVYLCVRVCVCACVLGIIPTTTHKHLHAENLLSISPPFIPPHTHTYNIKSLTYPKEAGIGLLNRRQGRRDGSGRTLFGGSCLLYSLLLGNVGMRGINLDLGVLISLRLGAARRGFGRAPPFLPRHSTAFPSYPRKCL